MWRPYECYAALEEKSAGFISGDDDNPSLGPLTTLAKNVACRILPDWSQQLGLQRELIVVHVLKRDK